jgi:type I restriction enzyme S subunit
MAAREQLKAYRQAVLKHAFEGKLTAQWRVENKETLETSDQLLARIKHEREARYKQQLEDWQASVNVWEAKLRKKPSKPTEPAEVSDLSTDELAELPALPEGYVYTHLTNLGDLGRGKSKHRPRNDPQLFGGAYPFIQTGDVKAANRIIRAYSQTYNEVGLAQSKLWPEGTLCITIAANIAETAFLGFDGCFPDSVVGFAAFDNLVLSDYVELFIKAVRVRIEAYAPATAQKNINLTTLENLVVPLCSMEEQRYLVNQVEAVLSAVDQNEAEIEANLARADALRQSILKKAFSGQLVEQDPNDEPASALLARIKTERATLANSNKKSRNGKEAA